MSDMDDATLSREVALACGWTDGGREDLPTYMRYPGTPSLGSGVVQFATSLDACFGPGGPVEYAKAKGWDTSFSSDFDAPGDKFYSELYLDGHAVSSEYGSSPARALCLAFLAAVRQEGPRCQLMTRARAVYPHPSGC